MGLTGTDWSLCYSDEDAKAMGLPNRNAAADKNCKDRGYLGSRGDTGNWQDCGGWKFKIRCISPEWINSGPFNNWADDGCVDVGVRRYARQVNANGLDWQQAADEMMNNHVGPDFYGKTIVSKETVNAGAGGMWVRVYVNDDTCNPGWLGNGVFNGWNDDGCQSDPGVKRFARHVDAKGYDSGKAGDFLMNQVGPDFYGKQIVSKENVNLGVAGQWVRVYVKDDSCNPAWIGNDWNNDGCQSDPGVRRFARHVDSKGADWGKAGDYLMNNQVGPDFFGKQIVSKENVNLGSTAGQWVRVYAKDDSCNPTWLGNGPFNGWNNDGCTDVGVRQYARQIDAKGADWDKAGEYMKNNQVGADFYGKQIISKEADNFGGAGEWIRVHTADPTCGAKFEDEKSVCNQGNKIAFRKCTDWVGNDAASCKKSAPKGVVGWQACGIGSDPSGACSVRTKSADDFRCAWGQDCFAITSDAPSFDCDIDRLDNSVNRQDKNYDISLAPVCFKDLNGKFGTMHPVVGKTMTISTLFTLEASNWISANLGCKTFLKGDGIAIRTDDNVPITTSSLGNQFVFKFEKVQCQTDANLIYGNHVQLKCVGTNKYIKCGGGTCSADDPPNTCNNGDWQTFTIQSAEGKSGRVCFGDSIYISQTTGDKADITPAGGGNVWARKHATDINSILCIQGPNGSCYVDPTKEMADYEVNVRCQKLCTNQPTDPACTLGQCSPIQNWFKKYKNWIIAVVVIVILCMSSSGAIYLKMQMGL